MAERLENTSPLGKPWRFSGTGMRPNVLLMCKLLFLLLVLHSFQEKIHDPFLPFIRAFDIFLTRPGLFESLLKTLFLGARLCLIFNLRVRTAAIVLGLVVILVVLVSKPLFRNHIFIVGCLFLLSGLHRRDEEPWMLRLQMSLIYLGAFLNKSLDPDWRSGQFIETWLGTALENPFYGFFSQLLPEQWFAILLSWIVITGEFTLAVFFLVPRWRSTGVWLAIALHACFFVVVGRTIFGHFLEDILLALLVFLSWPASIMEVRMNPRLQTMFQPFQRLVNWDRQFSFSNAPPNSGAWFNLRIGHQCYPNGGGLFRFLKYNPVFYVFLFAAFNGIAYLASR